MNRMFEQQQRYTERINPDVAKVWIMAVTVNDPQIKVEVRHYDDQMIFLISDEFKKEINAGKIRADFEPEVLARILWSLIISRVMSLIIDKNKNENDRVFDRAREFMNLAIRGNY